MQWKKYRNVLALALSLAFVGLVSGCGGGGTTVASTTPGSGSQTPAPTTTAGIALPQEVSAISVNNGTATAQAMGLQARLMAVAQAAASLPAGSDYNTAITSKFIDEPALSVFDIIDTILKAVAQTHYADPANVNAGPYKAMVAWYDDNKGQTVKQMQSWTIDSKMVNGENVVSVWPDGQGMPGSVQVTIDKAPTQAADGSYTDYGKWTIAASFDQSGQYYFEASADTDANGMTVLTINQKQQDHVGNYPVTDVIKAVVHKTDTSGYGQVHMPDYEACDPGALAPGATNPCASGTVPEFKIEYAYNQDSMTYEKFDASGNLVPGSQIFKDRDNPVAMVYQYGVFDASGNDVQKSKSFGFPVTYTDGSGNTQQAYYGSWQGLHQLWSNGGSTVADGTTVTRADVMPGQTAPTFTVKSFAGDLARRTMVSSDISQLQGIPVQAFLNQNLTLIYDGTNSVWDECVNPDWTTSPMSCGSKVDFTSSLGELATDPSGQKMVNINGWDQAAGTAVQYGYSGGSFYSMDMSGMMSQTAMTPQDGDVLNVNIGGNIYIEYTGNFDASTDNSGWVQKSVTSIDQNTMMPTFDDSADAPFDFAQGARYELNNNGASFIVERTASAGVATDYTTSMEAQTIANPTNATTVVPAGTVFKQSWDNSADATTYTFDTTPGDANYMMLVYGHVSQQDQQSGHTAGDVVTDGGWGLFAYDTNGQQLLDANGNPILYNWQYASGQNAYGAATYLVNADGTYKLLDDPIAFQSLQLTTGGGQTLNFSLQFDGYMHGLPDMHQQLQQNNDKMTPDIAAKVVNIPAGTQALDEAGNVYYIKPLQTGVTLPIVTQADITAAGKTVPDLTLASQVDLSTIPAFVNPNLSATAPAATLKYVEGNAVQ